MSDKAFKLLVLFLLWLVYITIGVFIFKAVEGKDNTDRIEIEKSNAELLEKLKKNVTATYNMSESEFDDIVEQIQSASSSSSGPEWGYANTFSFIIQLLTTIGKLMELSMIY